MRLVKQEWTGGCEPAAVDLPSKEDANSDVESLWVGVCSGTPKLGVEFKVQAQIGASVGQILGMQLRWNFI